VTEFANRREAGRRLANELADLGGRSDVVVLALPRGGVPVGEELARELAAPLDVCLVRKLGAPDQPELAIGAVASGGVRVMNEELVMAADYLGSELDRIEREETEELERQEHLYRGTLPAEEVSGKYVVLVDDGLATGATMHAAVLATRERGPSTLAVAVPVAATDACERLRRVADRVVSLATPEPFGSIGTWYADFAQLTDVEVHDILGRARGALLGTTAARDDRADAQSGGTGKPDF
jgi:putative phosphoribosyl transferase